GAGGGGDPEPRLVARPRDGDALDRDHDDVAGDRLRADAVHRGPPGRAHPGHRGREDRRRELVPALRPHHVAADLPDGPVPHRDIAHRCAAAVRPGGRDDVLGRRRGRGGRSRQLDPHDRALHVQPAVQPQRGEVGSRLRGRDRLDARAAHVRHHGRAVRHRPAHRLLRGPGRRGSTPAARAEGAHGTMTSYAEAVAADARADLDRPLLAPPRRTGTRRLPGTVAYHGLMIVVVALYILPVVWAFSMSLRTNANVFDADQLIPHPVTFEHYENLFRILPDFWRYFLNTSVIAVTGTLGTLVSSSLAGYAMARFRFAGRNVLLVLLLLTLMVPGQATLIPQYVWFRDLGWLNTPLPIIVPMLFGSAFASFFFRQFFLT